MLNLPLNGRNYLQLKTVTSDSLGLPHASRQRASETVSHGKRFHPELQLVAFRPGNVYDHNKNLSLLYEADRSTRLAPFYDLVPARSIENLDHSLALNVGSMRDPGHAGRGH